MACRPFTVPTLVVSGRYDETTPALQETLVAGIADCEWVVFEESSHTPHRTWITNWNDEPEAVRLAQDRRPDPRQPRRLLPADQ